jgi:hypothetical protein
MNLPELVVRVFCQCTQALIDIACTVQVRAWNYVTYPPTDSASLIVNVASVSEPPVANSAAYVIGSVSSGAVVANLAASDEDPGTTLTFRLVGGDPKGAFSVSPTGQVRAPPFLSPAREILPTVVGCWVMFASFEPHHIQSEKGVLSHK